jgi:type IV pilus assembly protein PilN
VIRINLLPVREARRKAGVRQQMLLLAVSVGATVLLAALFHSWVLASIAGAEGRVKGLQAQLQQYKPQEQQVAAFKAKKAEITQKLEVIERLERSRSGPVHIMDELATHVPERVWLTELSADNGQIQLGGMSLDNELVALFLTALNDSPYFAVVELQETELTEVEKLKLNTFEISARLESPEEPYREQPEPAPAAPGKGKGKPAAGRAAAGAR